MYYGYEGSTFYVVFCPYYFMTNTFILVFFVTKRVLKVTADIKMKTVFSSFFKGFRHHSIAQKDQLISGKT